MGAVNSELEDLFQDKKRVRNPFVPIGNSRLSRYLYYDVILHSSLCLAISLISNLSFLCFTSVLHKPML